MNLHTLGREAEGMEMKLHSKSEYKAKVAAENGTAAAPAADNTVDAAVIVEALGGKDNILKVTNCYTRLRTELADPDKVQDDVLKTRPVLLLSSTRQKCPGGVRPEGQRRAQGRGCRAGSERRRLTQLYSLNRFIENIQ